jgi:hypothetical protein
MQGEVIKVHGVDHVILEQHGSIFNPKFVGRSVEDGKLHGIKLTQKGLVIHYLELAKQTLCYLAFLALFLVVLVLFN